MMSKENLPHIITALSFVVFIVLGLACASAPVQTAPTATNPYKPLIRTSNATIIGTVHTRFESSYQVDNVLQINNVAYFALLEAARQEHGGNIDIVDITWIFVQRRRLPTRYEYSANGKVISLGVGNQTSTATGVEGAVERAAEAVAENFSAMSRIAIVYITAQDRSTTEYITGELEHILRRQGYVIIDRSELNRVRAEQQFGTSGEVDDNTAAAIGNIAGANVVITGRVDGEGNLRRLRLRALDTSNAQVVGTASERL